MLTNDDCEKGDSVFGNSTDETQTGMTDRCRDLYTVHRCKLSAFEPYATIPFPFRGKLIGENHDSMFNAGRA